MKLCKFQFNNLNSINLIKILSKTLIIISILIFSTCGDNGNRYQSEYIYIFMQGSAADGALGGISNIDSLCNTAYNTTYSSYINVNNVKALMSTSTTDLKDIITNSGTRKVFGLKNDGAQTQLKSTWTEIFADQTIDVNLSTAIGLSSNWLSGSESDGTVYASRHCTDWTSDTDGVEVQVGSWTFTDYRWISFGNNDCDDDIDWNNNYYILCVGWYE